MEQASWYYANADKQRHGPVSAPMLKDLYEAGIVGPRTLVWCSGMPQWQALEQVAEGLGLRPTPPPHPLPPAAPAVAKMPEPDGPSTVHAAPQALELEPIPVAPSEPLPSDPSRDEVLSRAYAAQVRADPQPHRGPSRGGHVIYAGFLKRVAASFIDGVIVGLIGMVLGGAFGLAFGVALLGSGTVDGSSSSAADALGSVLGLVIGIAYYAGFHASVSQATPGKMLIGIKVARGDGQRLTPLRAALRFLATYINMLTLGIGWLLAAFTDRKQALHDFICDTVVVDRWAYTAFPERQDETLGGCAIAVLILLGVITLAGIAALVGLIAVAGSMGDWK
jgi:uncharacterized RDD family membrane protein YckC